MRKEELDEGLSVATKENRKFDERRKNIKKMYVIRVVKN